MSDFKTEPKLSEWYYEKCPLEEVYQCYLYEYARTSKKFCAAFNKRRLKSPPKPEYREPVLMGLGNGYSMSLYCPEFPLTPWLDIPKETRKRRVFQQFIFDALAITESHPNAPIGLNPETGEEVVKLEICWKAQNTKIVKDFSDWIDRNIDQRVQKIGGRQQPIKEAKGNLKALSAYRLQLVFNFSYKDAADLTKKFTQSKVELYVNETSWSRAVKKAKDLLKCFNPE